MLVLTMEGGEVLVVEEQLLLLKVCEMPRAVEAA